MYYEKETKEKSEKIKLTDSLLWKDKSYNVWLILIAASFLLFTFLNLAPLWLHESSLITIVQKMITEQAFLHPHIPSNYYHYPVLTLWSIYGLTFLFHDLSIWAMRLPSVAAGIIILLCTYELGRILSHRQTGLIASWLLMTSGYFIFYSRIGNSDILSLAGIMLAVTWYFLRRNKPNFFTYLFLFFIVALTALSNGLMSLAAIFIALLPDLIYQKNWKTHFNFSIVLGFIPGFLLYLFPLFVSLYFKTGSISPINFLSTVMPFHLPPIFKGLNSYYLYLAYLPLVSFPWILLTIPALLTFPVRWRLALPGSRWLFWSMILLAVFFLGISPYHHYNLLLLLPFLMLFTADWIHQLAEKKSSLNRIIGKCVIVVYMLILLLFLAAIPIFYSHGKAPIIQQEMKPVDVASTSVLIKQSPIPIKNDSLLVDYLT